MSEAPQSTPAERAEARRLKILAKKNARMAYAAGDRERLPSSAPVEPIAEVPLYRVPVSAEGPSQSTNVAAASASGEEPLRAYATTSRGRAVFGEKGRGPFHSLVESESLRSLLLALAAIVLSVSMVLRAPQVSRVSSIELFGTIQLCFAAAPIAALLQQWFRTVARPTQASSLIGFAMNAFAYASTVRRVYRDFTLYMFVFFVSHYFAEQLLLS